MYGVNWTSISAYEPDDQSIQFRQSTCGTEMKTKQRFIAIVDDDELVRLSMSSLMRCLGYRVELYADGASLLETNLALLSCVVSDIQMPGMTGLELQAAILERAPGVPLIFMTAFPDEWARIQAAAAGARGFLDKPCDIDELVSLVEAIVGPGEPRCVGEED